LFLWNRRKHIKPQFSQTIMLPNVYNNPGHTTEGQGLSKQELQSDFDRFYEDIFIEFCSYGHLLELHVSIPPASYFEEG
jgi:splicing factor U2AF subunit